MIGAYVGEIKNIKLDIPSLCQSLVQRCMVLDRAVGYYAQSWSHQISTS